MHNVLNAFCRRSKTREMLQQRKFSVISNDTQNVVGLGL